MTDIQSGRRDHRQCQKNLAQHDWMIAYADALNRGPGTAIIRFMNRFIAILLGLLALICAALALVTAINLGFILMRPDSVSVANVLVAQGLWIVVLSATATVLFRKARSRLVGTRPDRE